MGAVQGLPMGVGVGKLRLSRDTSPRSWSTRWRRAPCRCTTATLAPREKFSNGAPSSTSSRFGASRGTSRAIPKFRFAPTESDWDVIADYVVAIDRDPDAYAKFFAHSNALNETPESEVYDDAVKFEIGVDYPNEPFPQIDRPVGEQIGPDSGATREAVWRLRDLFRKKLDGSETRGSFGGRTGRRKRRRREGEDWTRSETPNLFFFHRGERDELL